MKTIERLLELAARHLLITTISVLGLIAVIGISIIPESPAAKERDIQKDLARGEVAQIAKSPDGATVWAVQRDGRTIYFSKGSIAVEPAADPAT